MNQGRSLTYHKGDNGWNQIPDKQEVVEIRVKGKKRDSPCLEIDSVRSFFYIKNVFLLSNKNNSTIENLENTLNFIILTQCLLVLCCIHMNIYWQFTV